MDNKDLCDHNFQSMSCHKNVLWDLSQKYIKTSSDILKIEQKAMWVSVGVRIEEREREREREREAGKRTFKKGAVQ